MIFYVEYKMNNCQVISFFTVEDDARSFAKTIGVDNVKCMLSGSTVLRKGFVQQ